MQKVKHVWNLHLSCLLLSIWQLWFPHNSIISCNHTFQRLIKGQPSLPMTFVYILQSALSLAKMCSAFTFSMTLLHPYITHTNPCICLRGSHTGLTNQKKNLINKEKELASGLSRELDPPEVHSVILWSFLGACREWQIVKDRYTNRSEPL